MLVYPFIADVPALKDVILFLLPGLLWNPIHNEKRKPTNGRVFTQRCFGMHFKCITQRDIKN